MRSMFYKGALVIGMSWIAAGPAHAQTRFAAPTTPPDLAHYTTAEQCVVATKRLVRRLQTRLPEHYDTTEQVRPDIMDSLPPAAVAFARQCTSKFNPDTVPLNRYLGDASDWVLAYVLAGNYAAADTVLKRELASTPVDSPTARISAVSEIELAYRNGRPFPLVRRDALDTVALTYWRGKGRNLRAIAAIYGILSNRLGWRRKADDQAGAMQRARDIMAYTQQIALTPAERAQIEPHTSVVEQTIGQALDVLHHQALLDSLRQDGPDAYLRMKRADWTQAGNASEKFPLGQTAQPIVADFWFAPKTTQAHVTAHATAHTTGHAAIPAVSRTPLMRPQHGRVSLLVFLNGGCRYEDAVYFEGKRMDNTSPCWDTYGALRRLKHDFPQVDITLVTQTIGYIGPSGPLSPEQEADTLDTLWLGFHHLPGTLAVATTPYFRLDAPDSRRIDRPITNNKNYNPNKPGHLMGTGDAFLVDPDGTIIYQNTLTQSRESDFHEFLTALMAWYEATQNPSNAVSSQGQ